MEIERTVAATDVPVFSDDQLGPCGVNLGGGVVSLFSAVEFCPCGEYVEDREALDGLGEPKPDHCATPGCGHHRVMHATAASAYPNTDG